MSNRRPSDAPLPYDNCSKLLGKSRIKQTHLIYSVFCLINKSLRFGIQCQVLTAERDMRRLFQKGLWQKSRDRIFVGGEWEQGKAWQVAMRIYCNKRKRQRVELPHDWSGTLSWPPPYCVRTPTCRIWRQVKALWGFCRESMRDVCQKFLKITKYLGRISSGDSWKITLTVELFQLLQLETFLGGFGHDWGRSLVISRYRNGSKFPTLTS